MIGNTTLYHLINNSLMPELTGNKEERLFREIWQQWQADLSTSASYVPLQKAFQLLRLKCSGELIKDGVLMESYAEKCIEKPPLKKLFIFFPSQHRSRFYIALIWQYLHFQYHAVNTMLRAESSKVHQQYIFMHYLTGLEQLMEDNDQKINGSTQMLIRKSFQYLMAFFWLKYEHSCQEWWHIKSLRYFKEELECSLSTIDDATSKLQEYLLDQLTEKPAVSQEEFERQAPLEILNAFKDEMQVIKDSLKQLGPSLEMKQDVFLRPKEVRKEFGIAENTLANYRAKGKLKDYKKVRNRYEYSRKELIDFLKEKHP